MTTAFVCLVLGALVVGWPGGSVRHRLGAGRRGSRAAELAGRWHRAAAIIRRHPHPVLVSGAGAVAGLGLMAGGPVAAVVAAAYAGLAGRALIRRSARRRAGLARAAALDDLAALAAELRTGLPPVAAGGETAAPADRIGRLTSSVWRLAERTGAPAADLVERIEADGRAADRAAATATAQAAGAQATAVLLAALPLGGIGLGVAIGADPVRVLLHTPIGAACATGALLLQVGGLLWADRLTAGVVR